MFEVNPLHEERKHYELSYVLVLFIYVPLGWYYSDYLFQFESDGFFTRLPTSVFAGIVLVLSKFKKISIFFLRMCTLIIGVWITRDFLYFAYSENYHVLFLTGSVQTPLIVSFGFYRRLDALLFFISTIIWGKIYFINHEFMYMYYPLLVGTYYLVHYVFLSNKKALVDNLVKNNYELSSRTKDLQQVNDKISQAAHDIRSPVMALEAIANSLETADPKKKQLLTNISNRINQIADDLLKTYKKNLNVNPTENFQTDDLKSTNDSSKKSLPLVTDETFNYNPFHAIQSTVSEKEAIYRREVDFKIQAMQVDLLMNLKISESELKRILSNLINNSIESFSSGKGKVGIIATDDVKNINIQIQDTGKGVPSELKQRLAIKGFTHGKEKGTGLGLNHAKETLLSIGGNLEIFSKQDFGTLIILTIPKV